MKVNDNKINELLSREEKYRDSLSKSMNNFGNFENLKLEELQKIFQEESSQFNIDDKRNIFVQCKIKENSINKEYIKKIKYNRVNKNGKKEVNEILVKIPIGIEAGQSIILYGKGNYIKELNKNSNLIVQIKLK